MATNERRSPRALWERIEQMKAHQGWTDTELEKRSGVNRSTYARLRTLKRSPLPDTVRRLALAVGMDPGEAFLLAGMLQADEPAPEPAEVEVDAETEELLAALPPERRAWLETVRAAERARLRELHEQAAEEAARAVARFARLVRGQKPD